MMNCRCILLLGLALIVKAESVEARWEGSVQIPGCEFRLVIDIARDGGGQWIGSAIAPGFGVKGAPLTGIVVTDSTVAFQIKGALGEPALKGKWAAEGSMVGTYEQAGHTAPFVLRKAGNPQVDLPRRSTSVSQKLEGSWQGEMNFAGRTIRVTLELANQNGIAKGTLILVGRRENKLPIDLITEDGSFLTVEITDAYMTYEGRVKTGSEEIAGTFRQGPFEAMLVLHGSGTAKP